VSSFVPKSHTPFQWAPQLTLDQIKERQNHLRAGLRAAKLGFRYHSPTSSVMEGVFSRGDRRTAAALERAYELGARLDGWQEELREDVWEQAFAETGVDPAFYNQRRRDGDEVFPWSHIDIGMKPEWLWEDWMDALEAGFVPDCTTEPCYDCGVCDHVIVTNRVYKDDVPDAKPVHRIRKRYGIARKTVDPQFVAMPRPPAKKGNNVVDAVPPQGLAPGSAGARHSRTTFDASNFEAREKLVDHRGVPLSPSQIAQRRAKTEGTPDWREVFDTRLPPEWRLRARVVFGKRGPLAHLGHLDLMNVFRRALKRADAPVIWTQGFHPQIRMSFVPPLPSGCASRGELMDVELHRPVDLDAFREALAQAMPEDLPILDVSEVPLKGPSLQEAMESSIYVFSPGSDVDAAWVEAQIGAFERGDTGIIEVIKRKKGRERVRSVDLHDVVRELSRDGRLARVEVAAHGAGARIREVIAGIFGAEALSAPGATLERAAIRFKTPDDPPLGASDPLGSSA
jgi:radical SAM-linked protein